jgi:hypothetical protein
VRNAGRRVGARLEPVNKNVAAKERRDRKELFLFALFALFALSAFFRPIKRPQFLLKRYKSSAWPGGCSALHFLAANLSRNS